MRTTIVLFALAGCAAPATEEVGPATGAVAAGTFEEVASFGDNPGALKMYRYVPSPAPPAGAPLVVALHACSQTATTYRAAGWDELADAHGFYVLYPEQQIGNNSLRCFNWAGEYSDPTNLRRGEGENRSIASMVERMIADHGIDRSRIFVMGHSAGGAQAALLMATWPDLYAAGGILAGIPFHCTTEFARVSSCLSPGIDKTPAEHGDFVRAAYPGYTGRYPRVSLWQGTGDSFVRPMNQTELFEQWSDAHRIDTTADGTDMIDGATRTVYRNAGGDVAIETWSLSAGHGTFVDPDHGCGRAGSFFLDVNVCAVAHLAAFFGITGAAPPPGSDAGTGPGPGPGDDAGSGPGPGPGPAPSDDHVPPVVDVVAPGDGDVVVGETSIVVDAQDDGGIDRVVVRVDGRDVRSLTAPPYRLRWESTGVADGEHAISAIAYDRAGNERADDDTIVTVVNSGAPPSRGDGDGGMGPGSPDDGGQLACDCRAGGPTGSGAIIPLLLAGLVALRLWRRR